MNTTNFYDEIFRQTDTYKNFISQNTGTGILNIRAYAANSAIPISGLNVVVSKILDNTKVIFFEGATDSSGIIREISLPTPTIASNDLEVPASQIYDIEATYNNQKLTYKTNMYSGIQVLQNINVVPEIRLDGNVYGS